MLKSITSFATRSGSTFCLNLKPQKVYLNLKVSILSRVSAYRRQKSAEVFILELPHAAKVYRFTAVIESYGRDLSLSVNLFRNYNQCLLSNPSKILIFP